MGAGETSGMTPSVSTTKKRHRLRFEWVMPFFVVFLQEEIIFIKNS